MNIHAIDFIIIVSVRHRWNGNFACLINGLDVDIDAAFRSIRVKAGTVVSRTFSS